MVSPLLQEEGMDASSLPNRPSVRAVIPFRKFCCVLDDDIIANDSDDFRQALKKRLLERIVENASAPQRRRENESAKDRQVTLVRESPDSGVLSDANLTVDSVTAANADDLGSASRDTQGEDRFTNIRSPPSPEILPVLVPSTSNAQPWETPLLQPSNRASAVNDVSAGPEIVEVAPASDGEDSLDSEFSRADGVILPFGCCIVVSKRNGKKKCRAQCEDGKYVRVRSLEKVPNLQMLRRLAAGFDQVIMEEVQAASDAARKAVRQSVSISDHTYCQNVAPSRLPRQKTSADCHNVAPSRLPRQKETAASCSSASLPVPSASPCTVPLESYARFKSLLEPEEVEDDVQSTKSVSVASDRADPIQDATSPEYSLDSEGSGSSASSEDESDDCADPEMESESEAESVNSDIPARTSKRQRGLSLDVEPFEKRPGLRRRSTSSGKEEVRSIITHKWLDDETQTFLVVTSYGNQVWMDSSMVPDSIRFEYQIGRSRPATPAATPPSPMGSAGPTSRRSMAAAKKIPAKKRSRWEVEPATVEDGKEFFYVEKIRGKRVTEDGVVEYLVKWRYCSEAENSWEPVANLSCDQLIEAYNSTYGKEDGSADSDEA